MYDLNGGHVMTVPDHRWSDPRREEIDAAIEAVPTRTFAFADFDGEKLTATTRIEEREWRFGTGWFRWLSMFRSAKIVRSIDIRFSGETGKRKGSWKGGTTGCGGPVLRGELHEDAFRRYCAENSMTFIDEVQPQAAE